VEVERRSSALHSIPYFVVVVSVRLRSIYHHGDHVPLRKRQRWVKVEPRRAEKYKYSKTSRSLQCMYFASVVKFGTDKKSIPPVRRTRRHSDGKHGRRIARESTPRSASVTRRTAFPFRWGQRAGTSQGMSEGTPSLAESVMLQCVTARDNRRACSACSLYP